MRLVYMLGIILATFSSSLVAQASRYDDGQGAISGYDAVAYFTEGKAIKGHADFQYKWQEINWYFANAEHLKLFQADPQKYAPQNGGFCSWAASRGYLASADPAAWHIENNKLYLNYNQNVLKEFRKDLNLHITRSHKNWPELVKQVPEYLENKN